MQSIFNFNTISKYRTELMGLAILGVMCGHLMNHTVQPIILSQLVRMIHTYTFIFLSGFGLYYSLKKSHSVTSFYKRRLARIYVPYLVITLPFWLILLISGNCDVLHFVAYVTTVDFWIEGNYYAMWYIAVSLLLYAIAPLLFAFLFKSPRRSFHRVSIVTVLILIGLLFLNWMEPAYYDKVEIGIVKVLIFPLGMYSGRLAEENKSLNPLTVSVILIFSVIFFYINRTSEFGDFFRSFIGIVVSVMALSTMGGG